MDFIKSVKNLPFVRHLSGRRASSMEPDGKVLKFSVDNAIFFFAVSVLTKLSQLSILVFNWSKLASLEGFLCFLRMFLADAEATAPIFFSAFTLIAIAARINFSRHATALSYALQLAYFIYCIAYVEYYREFRKIMTVTALMQVNWLWTWALPTMKTIITSINWMSVAAMTAAAALTTLFILPAITDKLDRKSVV